MILHPRFSTLRAYDDGTLPPAHRARVAAHLLRCARCRAAVAESGAARDALRQATAPPLPPGAWNAIAARHAAGERVILPAMEPAGAAPARRARPMLRAVAAIAVLLMGGTAVALSTSEAAAEASELRLSPEAPGAGATVRVTYRPGGLLSGADRLVLRARMVDDEGEPAWELPVLPVAELRRAGDGYAGSFTLPDSVVYAVFAVEDAAGERVDHNGEQWELVVHDTSGRPLAPALSRRAEDLGLRDTREAARTWRRLVELHPESVGGWRSVMLADLADAPESAADSVRAVHRARLTSLDSALRARPAPRVEDAAMMVFYAEEAGDSAMSAAWKERLLAMAPHHPSAVQQRVFALAARHRGDRPGLFAAMEALWAEVGGRSPQLPFTAFQVAQQARDGAALLRWGDRLVAGDAAFTPVVARGAMAVPEIRPRAMERVRQALRWLEAPAPGRRPLNRTVSEYRRELDRARGLFLGMLGRGLVEGGQTRAGLDTLSLAVRTAWDPALFRGIADARLALGDTAGALGVLARVAADPGTAAAFADSARGRLGRAYQAEAWAREVAAARGEMRAATLEQSIQRGVRGTITLADAAGARRTLEPAGDGPTFIALWSRFCPPSRMDLPRLRRVAADLATRGVRVITIPAEPASPELQAFVTEQELTMPMLFDDEHEAARALQNQGTPTYLVLDGEGRIRFESHRLDDVLRQVEVLRTGS